MSVTLPLDNPAAFPTTAAQSGGMWLRDYFAAHALTWALFEATDDNGTNLKAAAITAYLAADAMLRERSEGAQS